MVRPHNQSGQVSIADRVHMQALAVAALPVLRLGMDSTQRVAGELARQVYEPGFAWRDAKVALRALEVTSAAPGEPVETVALKASLRAWAQMGADRERAVAVAR
jgi:hypothetical protein